MCLRCGKPKHLKGEKCYAENAECRSCKGNGHFEKVCVKSGKAEFINHVFTMNNENKYEIQTFINDKPIKLLYDTGSSKSIIPENFYNRIDRPKLFESKQLFAYPNKPIATLGEIKVKMKIGTKTKICNLTVVPGRSTPILGKDLMKLFTIEPKFTINSITDVHAIESELLKKIQ